MSLRATKETTRGRSMAALVNACLKLKIKIGIYFWMPRVLPTGLFGNAVNIVIERFQEAKKQAEAFK